MLITRGATPKGSGGGKAWDGLSYQPSGGHLTQAPGQEAVQCIQAEVDKEEGHCHMGPCGPRDGTCSNKEENPCISHDVRHIKQHLQPI